MSDWSDADIDRALDMVLIDAAIERPAWDMHARMKFRSALQMLDAVPARTLRDEFAGRAMQALAGATATSRGFKEYGVILPRLAYAMANAMLAERSKRNDPPALR